MAVEGITAAEQAAGVALLDAAEGESTSTQTDGIMRAKSEVAAIDAAIHACRSRRLEAIRAKRQGDAAELRRQVEELRKQVDELAATTAKHIAAISESEGMPFIALPAPAVFGQVSRSQELQSQIASFEIRAAALEADELPRAGGVDVQDVVTTDELLLAVLRHLSDGPSAENIIAWAAGCEKHGRASRRRDSMDQRDFGDSLRNFHLSWRQGKIVYDESHVQIPTFIRTEPGQYSGNPVAELGSDIFRCPAPARCKSMPEEITAPADPGLRDRLEVDLMIILAGRCGEIRARRPGQEAVRSA